MTPDAQRHERKRETGTDRDGQKEGEGDRQTETDRQRQTEIDRQTDRHRRTQEERAREEEKRRGTRREGDGAANWSQTQFSAARAAQASHQKTRPTIIQAQTLNPKLSGAPVPGHEPASTCRFSGRGGWWPPANNNSASNRSLFYTISRCSLYHEQVSSHTSAFATTCSFSSSLPPRHTYAYTQSALKHPRCFSECSETLTPWSALAG